MKPSIEFRDPSDLPQVSYRHHPVDDMEPKSAPCDNDERFAASILSDALLFLADAVALPEIAILPSIGRRVLGVLQKFDRAHETIAPAVYEGYTCDADALAAGRAYLGRIFGWLAASGARLSDYGMRGMVLLYVVRPDLLDGATLDTIGTMDGRSRQAVDKLVVSLRDSALNGFRNRQMKEDSTRDKCRISQLS